MRVPPVLQSSFLSQYSRFPNHRFRTPRVPGFDLNLNRKLPYHKVKYSSFPSMFSHHPLTALQSTRSVAHPSPPFQGGRPPPSSVWLVDDARKLLGRPTAPRPPPAPEKADEQPPPINPRGSPSRILPVPAPVPCTPTTHLLSPAPIVPFDKQKHSIGFSLGGDGGRNRGFEFV